MGSYFKVVLRKEESRKAIEEYNAKMAESVKNGNGGLDVPFPPLSDGIVLIEISLSVCDPWCEDIEETLHPPFLAENPISEDELEKFADDLIVKASKCEKEFYAQTSYKVKKSKDGYIVKPVREIGEDTFAGSSDLYESRGYYALAERFRQAAKTVRYAKGWFAIITTD